MNASKFYSLKNIQGKKYEAFFRRNKYGKEKKLGGHCKPGVYFWGFYLGDRADRIPQKPDDLVIYYIGKTQKNVPERIMQEFTQLILGGFGTIYKPAWLVKHPFDADLYNLQESDKNGNPLNSNVLYKSDGLHVLNKFYTDKNIKMAVKWMFDRMIFAWIMEDKDVFTSATPTNKYLAVLESELHKIAGRNTLGLGANPTKKFLDVKNNSTTPLFHKVNWKKNEVLKEWLINVNLKLHNEISNKVKI